MAKVGESIGVNIALTDNRFDRYVPTFSIQEIDTEKDIDFQIEQSKVALEKIHLKLTDFAENTIREEAQKDVKLQETR